MNVDDSKLAMQGYCPVSYHFGPPVKGLDQYTTEYEGAIYKFGSAKGKELFDADPAKYVPLYGGWCGYGMAIGHLTPIDPLNFKFVGENKELVLFYQGRQDEYAGHVEQGRRRHQTQGRCQLGQ